MNKADIDFNDWLVLETVLSRVERNLNGWVVELGQSIERKVIPVGAAVGGLIALAGTAAFAAHRVSVKRHKNEWRNVLARTLGRSRPERPSFLGEAARKVGLSLLVLLVNEGAKRAVQHSLAASKNIDGRPQGSVS